MVSGIFWVAGTKAIAQTITWLITIVVVQLLSPQDYGLMGMAILFTSFLLLFNDLGLGASIIQDPDLDDERLSHLRSAIFAINVFLFLLLLLLAPWLARFFREPALVGIVRVLSCTFVLNGIGAPSGYVLARELDFKRKSRAELFGSLSGGLSTLAFAWSGFGVWSLVLGQLFQQVTTNTLYCIFRPLRFTVFSIAKIRRSMTFGVKVAVSSILWYISSNADFAIIGRVLGGVQLGLYTLAFQFASLPIEKMVTVVTQVAFPSFSTMQGDPETLRRYYVKIVSALALATFPMFLGLFLVADSGVTVLLKAKWLPMVLPLRILCVVSCLRAIETMNAPLLLAKGRPQIALLNNLLQAIVLPIAFYIGARSGILGVAVAWLIVWPVLYTIVTVQTARVIGLKFTTYLNGIKHPVLGSAFMVAVALACQRTLLASAPPATMAIATIAIGSAAYAGYNIVFNRSALREALDLVGRRTPRVSPTVDSALVEVK
jgi:teichuronic acid exporter